MQPTKLAELSIGDHQSAQGLQALCGLGRILLATFLVDGEARALGVTGGNFLSLPDEVLDKFALVLDQEHLLRGINHIAQVGHEGLSIG